MDTIKKTIKVGDNFLTLGHYKEPLTALPEGQGFGFYGALLGSLDGEKVQCHICGGVYKFLGGHVRQSHKMDPVDYREQFQLAYMTSLVSEKERERRKKIMLDYLATRPKGWLKKAKLNASKGGLMSKGTTGHQLRLESLNKRGVCPEQLLAKIKEIKEKLKKVPSLKEFVAACGTQRYKHLIFKVYGSWNQALEKLNLSTKPSARDAYTKKELLDALKDFYKNTGLIPTRTDCVRHLLPSYSVYFRNFGGMKQARFAANIV